MPRLPAAKKRNNPQRGRDQPSKPTHPEPRIGHTRFPGSHANRNHRYLKADIDPVGKVLAMPLPKELVASLEGVAAPTDRCATARTYIISQVGLGAPFDRVASAIGVDGGDITIWSISSAVNTALMAVALQQAAERYDELARAFVEKLDPTDPELNIRVLIAYANSLRSGAEGARALSQGMCRLSSRVADTLTHEEKRAADDRHNRLTNQRRVAEKLAKKQQSQNAHDRMIGAVGWPPGPNPSEVLGDHDQISSVEYNHLSPLEAENLLELFNENRLAEASTLVLNARRRWRSEHAKLPPTEHASLSEVPSRALPAKPRRTKKGAAQ